VASRLRQHGTDPVGSGFAVQRHHRIFQLILPAAI
jgi:hypothetical protein